MRYAKKRKERVGQREATKEFSFKEGRSIFSAGMRRERKMLLRRAAAEVLHNKGESASQMDEFQGYDSKWYERGITVAWLQGS